MSPPADVHVFMECPFDCCLYLCCDSHAEYPNSSSQLFIQGLSKRTDIMALHHFSHYCFLWAVFFLAIKHTPNQSNAILNQFEFTWALRTLLVHLADSCLLKHGDRCDVVPVALLLHDKADIAVRADGFYPVFTDVPNPSHRYRAAECLCPSSALVSAGLA